MLRSFEVLVGHEVWYSCVLPTVGLPRVRITSETTTCVSVKPGAIHEPLTPSLLVSCLLAQNCMLAPAMVAGFICLFNIGSNALLVHYYGFVVRHPPCVTGEWRRHTS